MVIPDIIFWQIIAGGGVLIFALVGFIMITFPVAWEYFLASMGSKYLLITVDKTNTIRLCATKFKNGTATIDKGTAKFIKTDLDGSMSLGNCKCDIVHKNVSVMAQLNIVGALDQLAPLGINDVKDLCERINYVTMVEAGLIAKPKSPRDEEFLKRCALLKNQMENQLSILRPAIMPVKLKNIVQYGVVTPQMLKSDEEESIVAIAKQYSDLLSNKKGSNAFSDMIPLVIVLGVIIMGIIAILMYAKGM